MHTCKLCNLTDDLLSLISKKNENCNLAAVSKDFNAQMYNDMTRTKEFASCVKQVSEGNELDCLELARSVKYPLKCEDFCKLRKDEWDCERYVGPNPLQESFRGFCSDVSLTLDYPLDRSQITPVMNLYMLLFAQGNRQMRLTMHRHPPLLQTSDFFDNLEKISSYNPLASVEFPCYTGQHLSTGAFEHKFPIATFVVQDLKFLVKCNIRFKSVIIYHYPSPYDPFARLFTFDEDRIKATIDPELSDYMESLFPNTLQIVLAAAAGGGSDHKTCGRFPGPCVLLIYGDITGYSYANYILKKATDSQKKEIAQINVKRQRQRQQNTQTFEYGLVHLIDEKYYPFDEDGEFVQKTGAELKALILNAQKHIDSEEATKLQSNIAFIKQAQL